MMINEEGYMMKKDIPTIKTYVLIVLVTVLAIVLAGCGSNPKDAPKEDETNVTSIPEPTNTPKPTNTPTPTNAPEPTSSPVPTNTPASTPAIVYTISYDAQGGIGAPQNQEKIQGKDIVLSSIQPTRDGFSFLGWAKSPDSSSVAYASGDIYSDDATIVLYAVWSEKQVSDWVLTSVVPTGAKIVDEKWVYTKTTWTTSEGTYVWADFSKAPGFDKSNELYTKYNTTPMQAVETEKRVVTLSEPQETSYIYFHWCEGKSDEGGPYDRFIQPSFSDRFCKFCAFETKEWKEIAKFWDEDWQGYGVRWNNAGACSSCDNWFTVTVYTQTYTEKIGNVENGESDTEVSGDEYSSVQRFVKYQ